MATYARIQGGIVAELFTPPTGVAITACFAPGLTWVECDGTAGVAEGLAPLLVRHETGGVGDLGGLGGRCRLEGGGQDHGGSSSHGVTPTSRLMRSAW